MNPFSRVSRGTQRGRRWEYTNRPATPMVTRANPDGTETIFGGTMSPMGTTSVSNDDGQTWEGRGDHRGETYALLYLPPTGAHPERLVTGTDCCFQTSDDEGWTWNRSTLGSPVLGRLWPRSLTFRPDPAHPAGGVVFAGGQSGTDNMDNAAEIWRSDDRGSTFTFVRRFRAADMDMPVQDFLIDMVTALYTTRDGTVWAGVRRWTGGPAVWQGRIFRSTDAGQTWHRADDGMASTNGGFGLMIHSFNQHRDGRLFAATERGVWHTAQTFVTAAETPTPLAASPTISVRPNPSRGSVEVVVTSPLARPLRVEVVDVQGRRVADVYDGGGGSGEMRFRVETAGWAPGTYVARVLTNAVVVAAPFTVVR